MIFKWCCNQIKNNSFVSEWKSRILIGLTCSAPQLVKYLLIFLSLCDPQYQLKKMCFLFFELYTFSLVKSFFPLKHIKENLIHISHRLTWCTQKENSLMASANITAVSGLPGVNLQFGISEDICKIAMKWEGNQALCKINRENQRNTGEILSLSGSLAG